MESQIGFDLSDILEYFTSKRGKVVYTELVTYFKKALSNPETQAQARTTFKDHVNTLATVLNENGTKYLVLRSKYMKSLFGDDQPSSALTDLSSLPAANSNQNQSNKTDNDIPTQITSPIASVTPKQTIVTSTTSDSVEKHVAPSAVAIANDVVDNTTTATIIPDTSDIPPRPPPRKKGSFSKGKSPQIPITNIDKENQEINNSNSHSKMGVESNHEVKKEIQELARTPGRVKEHAQILNKLASSADYKLPMPSVNSSVHSQVVNKIRNGYHGNDSDSGSVQIADSLKKKWIIAASNCDYSELCSLLKEDSNLSSYCDFITGYNALHWAAKFNKPNIIKLIAGKHGVNPNVKSFSGCTPLHLAAQFKNQLIIKLLIESYGANIDIRDNYGKKPFHYIEPNGKKANDSDNSSSTNAEKVSTNASNSNVNNIPSATENLKNNLRNKISHQSMLVRNKLRQSKAFQKRKTSFSSK